MNFETTRKELLRSMNQISINMPELIFSTYFDKLGGENKYLLSMFDDAYKTVDLFCVALQKVAVAQAGLLLRQLLEQTAICFILVEHRDLLPKYVEHSKFRIQAEGLKNYEIIEEISKKYNVPKNKSALAYMDYGWLGFDDAQKCNEDGMLAFAGFNDIISWRKKYLDKLAHASFNTTNFIGKEGDFPIIDNFIQIAGKLFDHLCVAFHNLTKFNFVFENKDLFNDDFRKLYESYKLPSKE